MVPEVISLISSSPPPPRATTIAKPPNPRKRTSGAALDDVTGGALNSRPGVDKRSRRESPPPKNRFLESLELSDFSDLDGLPGLGEPRPRAVARDPTLLFEDRTKRRSPTPVRHGATRRLPALDDPIELSSTPDLPPRRKPDVRAGTAREASARPAAGPFLFSSSPERMPSPPRENIRQSPEPARCRRPTPPRNTSRSTYPVDSPSPSPTRSVLPTRPPREWDPISSSAPEQRKTIIELYSDIEIPDITSDDSFPELENISAAPVPSRSYRDLLSLSPPSKPRAKTTLKRASSYNVTSTINRTSAAAPKRTAEERAREKEARAAAREAEKAQKTRERDEAKAVRAREKERAAALAEANKVRTDKKVSAKEMIVDLPSGLDEGVALQARTLLGDLGVGGCAWESPVAGVVRWRRKVRSVFDEERGHYEPVPERIETEGIVMAILRAEEFVEMALGTEGRDLDRHVGTMKRHFPGSELLYLVEGLELWSRRNRALRNRQFAAAARAEAQSRRAAAREPVDEEVVEEALLGLQVRHGARIHHAAAGIETARWIATFTQHVSTAPYRRRRDEMNDAAAAFCMDAGQVRCGERPAEVYVGMLQEVGRVSAAAAYGVAEEFGDVGELVRGLERGGALALQGCRKAVGRGGELGERTVGQALSRKIYKVFMGTDEDSTDV